MYGNLFRMLSSFFHYRRKKEKKTLIPNVIGFPLKIQLPTYQHKQRP